MGTDLRDAARQALEVWDQGFLGSDLDRAMDALRAALEQPEQEPVAIVSSVTEPGQYGVKVRWLGGFPQIAMKLYTHPPRREWRGLTDEEIYPLYSEPSSDAEMVEFARAIEAALKERNA